MDRKTIITCIVAIAVLLTGVVVAVVFLYSGLDRKNYGNRELLSDGRFRLMHAVPSDALLVMRFSDMQSAADVLADSSSFSYNLSGRNVKNRFSAFMVSLRKGKNPLKPSETVISLHYNGDLAPLMILDAGRADETPSRSAEEFMTMAVEAGLYAEYLNCGECAANDYLSKRGLVIVSSSDVLVKSSQRHISEGISVMDSEGFAEVAGTVQGSSMVFVSNRNIGKIMNRIMPRKYASYSDFLKRTGHWTAMTVDESSGKSFSLSGFMPCADSNSDFQNVFEDMAPSAVKIAGVLPSRTIFFTSLPVADAKAYIDAYEKFSDAKGRLGKFLSKRDELAKAAGISPKKWAEALNIDEIGYAAFDSGASVYELSCFHVRETSLDAMFPEIGKIKDYKPAVHDFKYSGFMESLFGKLFGLKDQSCYTYTDGWIVSGSRGSVEKFIEENASGKSLKTYLTDTGLYDRLFSKSVYVRSYFSIKDAGSFLETFFKKDYADALKEALYGYSEAVVSFEIRDDRKAGLVDIDFMRVRNAPVKLSVSDKDTIVNVPSGPFPVKNSGTGRMNRFLQQENLYLCLQEENGKGIWAVPFDGKLCGRAGTVDYFANGKLQIMFASGSKIYLIDRLGRFVSPFPLDLRKEVLLGPDIYDFNGKRKYNIMVLHKDNTVRMYNLQGKVPAQWKDITASETIKDLPERIVAGGKSYWVVRTSIQTLIFGFYGGTPLTDFKGDDMIRNDSPVLVNGSSVEVVAHDGKKRVIKL